MTLNTVATGQVKPNDNEAEKEIPASVIAKAIGVKALTTNEDLIWIGPKGSANAASGYPLKAGESVSLDLGGKPLFFKCVKKSATEGIAFITLAP